jgi:hypothetical protein
MNGLMKKLEQIQEKCVEKGANVPVEDENADDFTRLKRKLAYQVKSIQLFLHFISFSLFSFHSWSLPLCYSTFILSFVDIRQLIHERDEVEKINPGTVAVVGVSQKITHSMREAEKDTKQLDKLQKEEKLKYQKKNKTDEETERQIEHR